MAAAPLHGVIAAAPPPVKLCYFCTNPEPRVAEFWPPCFHGPVHGHCMQYYLNALAEKGITNPGCPVCSTPLGDMDLEYTKTKETEAQDILTQFRSTLVAAVPKRVDPPPPAPQANPRGLAAALQRRSSAVPAAESEQKNAQPVPTDQLQLRQEAESQIVRASPPCALCQPGVPEDKRVRTCKIQWVHHQDALIEFLELGALVLSA
jgi:hypothetical protein